MREVISKFDQINRTMNRYSICENDLNRKMSINVIKQSQRYTQTDKKRERLEALKSIAVLDGKISYWKDKIDPAELKLDRDDTESALIIQKYQKKFPK